MGRNFVWCSERVNLGPLLLSIVLCDLIFMIGDTAFASYADDKLPFVIGKDIDEFIKLLEHDSLKLFQSCYGIR